MNKENAHLYIPHVEALRDGELQVSSIDGTNWCDVYQVNFDLPLDRYRRKPKPREWFMVVEKDGSALAYPKQSDAEIRTFLCRQPTIRVREVIE